MRYVRMVCFVTLLTLAAKAGEPATPPKNPAAEANDAEENTALPEEKKTEDAPPRELVRYLDAVDAAWQIHGKPVYSEDLYGRLILIYYYDFKEGRTPVGASQVSAMHRQGQASKKLFAIAALQAGSPRHAAAEALRRNWAMPVLSGLPFLAPAPQEEGTTGGEGKKETGGEKEAVPTALPAKLPVLVLYNTDGTYLAHGSLQEVSREVQKALQDMKEAPPHPYLRNVKPHYCKSQATALTGSGVASSSIAMLKQKARTKNSAGLEAAAILKAFDESTGHSLNMAKAMIQKYPLRAMPVLENLARRFPRTPVGTKAASLSATFKGDVTYKEYKRLVETLQKERLSAVRSKDYKNSKFRNALIRLIAWTSDTVLLNSTPVRRAVISGAKQHCILNDFTGEMDGYKTLEKGFRK